MSRNLMAVLALCCLALVSCGDDDNNDQGTAAPNQVSGAPPLPTLLPIAPTPVPTPIPPPPGNQPPAMAFKINPQPTEGPAPLKVEVNMCGSSDPDGDQLSFLFKFGDGVKFTSIKCRDSIKYQSPGRFESFYCVDDGYVAHRLCRTVFVKVQ